MHFSRNNTLGWAIKNAKRLAFCSLVFCAGQMYAQQQGIRLPQKAMTLQEIFKEIEEQTRMSVDYNNSKVTDAVRKTKVNVDGGNVREVLEDALKGTGLSYRIEGNHVVIFPQEKPADGKRRQISGVVLDDKGDPVIGGTVRQRGTDNGTITDMDGRFTLTVPDGAVLTVSYVGYESRDVVADASDLKIKLHEDTKVLDEVVVIGYGTTSKKNTTASITSLDAEEIAATPVSNVTQSLAGRAPGLIVTQSGGGIGATSSISIRGGGTPLYVIDDIVSEERDFQNLNPDDIEQLTILKDASATAIYGARAANGIIMVVTKQGKAGKMNVNYNFNYNFSQPTYLPDKLDSYNLLFYRNQASINDGIAPPTSEEDLQKYKDGSDPINYPNTDWMDLCLRNFSPEQRHNLSVSGGSENIRIYSGLGYYDQESIYRTNAHNMQRYNFRTNAVAKFDKIGLKVTTGVDAYIWKMRQPSTHQGTGYSTIWSHLIQHMPTQLAYNKNGQIFSGTNDNPLIDLSSDGGYYRQERTSVRGNLGLEWSVPWVKGLTLKAVGNYTIVNDRDKTWQQTPYSYDLEGNPNTPGKPNLTKNTYYHNNFTTQFLADYNNTFGEVHTVGATIGLEVSGSDVDNNSLSRQEYLLNIDQINYGPVNTAKNSASEYVGYRRAAVIARVKYDYAAKYLVEASMRYDGSDYFPKDNRWGTFFSGSVGWMVSEEDFWETLRDRHIFDTFKLRASYGEIGLDGSTDGRLGRYEYVPSYNYSERGGYIGQAFLPGLSEGGLVATDITWYTSKNMNVGLDFSSLRGRLSGTIEYFRMSTTGYLSSPSNVGYTDPLGMSLPKIKSDGESIRQGGEFWLQYKDNVGELEYSVSGNLTFYDSRWNINPDEAETSLKNPYDRDTQVGSYWGSGYTCLGYYTDFNDVMNSPKRPSSVNLGAGDLKYEDFNGDGIIDGNDNHRIGTGSSPRMNYGINVSLNYRGWFMNMLWQGAGSYDIAMGSILQGSDTQNPPVIYDSQTDYWTPQNTDARYPRLHSNPGYNGNNNVATSDFWLVDSKYIRLKNLSIGYDFKHKLLRKLPWITKCSLALTGYNLLTFSPAKEYGMDPEIGSGNLFVYPLSRTYSISLNVGF